jgi:uncharacterized repeat protein (TIGR03803 family)
MAAATERDGSATRNPAAHPFVTPGSMSTLSPPAPESGEPWTQTVLYTGLTYPNAIVFGDDGTLYGTTYGGGVDGSNCGSIGCGTVYSLTPPATPGGAWTETTLYNFTGSGGDGDFPAAGVVIGPNGVLYGTTLGGGTGGCAGLPFPGCGTVFSLIPPASPGGAWTERVLYRFIGGSDGANPSTGLAMGSHGVLYGTTANTGNGSCQFVGAGCGTVFSLTAPASAGGAWTETTLYAFSGEDGDQPSSLVIGRNGVLYGTTISGGASNAGTVFSLAP